MKNLRRLAGISILLTLIFMVIALFQFEEEEEASPLLSQIEISFTKSWLMTSLNPMEISEAELENHRKIKSLIKAALLEGDCQEVSLPYTKNSHSAVVVLKNTLQKGCAGLMLSFSSANAAVRVVLDGGIIYESGFEENPISGSSENLVSIPSDFQDGELWIELFPFDLDIAPELSDIKIETRNTVMIGLVGNSIADVGCCLLIVIMSIIMFVLALIRRYTCQPARGEVFLGLAGLAAGIYCFIETNTLSIFYDIQEAYEMQEYLVLLIPIFITLYFERNLHRIYPRRFSVLLWCVNINAVAQILLRISGIFEMEQMINISVAALGIVCMAAIASLIQFDYQNRRYQTILSLLSMVVLLSGGVANVIANAILKDNSSNKAGQYSMVVFGIMMAVMHVLQLSKEYRANAEENARLLEEKVKFAEQQNIQLAKARQEAEAARQEAMAANEAKGKFLAHMSHEIRTPINAVLGMDEMILRESREESIKEYALDIYTAGQTLLSLINDILDFSKIESGKMEIVPVEYDISSLIHDLVNMVSQRAEDKNLKLEVEVDHEIPSRLYGDDVRLRQILTNILTNAVKYTHKGTVWLRVQSQKAEDITVLRFEVEDTGIGMKEEDLCKLSAEFERIEEDKNRNIEGSGLGMSITIQLLSLLGSSLQVESTYGTGSRFSFELEQRIIDHTPIGDFKARVRETAGNYHYKTRFCAPEAEILVVDDNAVNRKVLRNLLKETQIQITEAERGMECLELVQKNHYDLIFLDHMMPEMDGVETLHRIRELSDSPCQNTPVVVLTANAVSGAKEQYLSEGFDDFLSKPIVSEKLESMIKKLLPEQLLLECDEVILAQAEIEEKMHSGKLPNKEGKDGKTERIEKERYENAKISRRALEELPMVDGLDWNYAWLHLPDMELLEYTIKEFYAQIDSAAQYLEQAYNQPMDKEALNQYRIQVHAMKGLAATVGITPLAGLAKILEYAAKDSNISILASLTSIFLEEWRSYRQKLQGVFGIGNEQKEEVTDYSVIQALVEMVRLSMQELDIDQADKLMGQLQAYHYSEEINPFITKLAEAVTNLDAEETDRLAKLLIEHTEK